MKRLLQNLKNLDKETLIKLAQPAATLVLALCVLNVSSKIRTPTTMDVYLMGGEIGFN